MLFGKYLKVTAILGLCVVVSRCYILTWRPVEHPEVCMHEQDREESPLGAQQSYKRGFNLQSFYHYQAERVKNPQTHHDFVGFLLESEVHRH